MKENGKKEIGFVVLIVILLLLAVALYIGIFVYLPLPLPMRIGLAAIYLFIAGVIIYVARTRVKEIKGDEYDDLSKY